MTEFFSKKCFTPLLGIQYSGGRIEGNDGALVLMMFAMCMQKDNNKKIYIFLELDSSHYITAAKPLSCNECRVLVVCAIHSTMLLLGFPRKLGTTKIKVSL